MFINLSNHPSTAWPATQRAAAEALGGEIVDQPFPEVPPEAGSEHVAEVGAALASMISARSPAAVMVQGEFTLTAWVVSYLALRGVSCYAATTRRVAEVTSLPDGASERRARFEFVRFRQYCLAAPPPR